MSSQASPPFERFSFTLVADRKPRAAFQLTLAEDGTYALHFERGSASNPLSQFNRTIPASRIQEFKDRLQAIGVFGWSESYGSLAGAPAMRWSVSTVFREGVFSVASRGGSDVPQDFDAFLEELYRLDFPRPEGSSATSVQSPLLSGSAGLGALTGATGEFGNMGMLGQMGSAGFDFSKLSGMLPDSDVPLGEIAGMLDGLQNNPAELQRRMRDEYSHMTPDEKDALIDMLASTGMASREWWRRWLEG